jgi:hypothetical protein
MKYILKINLHKIYVIDHLFEDRFLIVHKINHKNRFEYFHFEDQILMNVIFYLNQ